MKQRFYKNQHFGSMFFRLSRPIIYNPLFVEGYEQIQLRGPSQSHVIILYWDRFIMGVTAVHQLRSSKFFSSIFTLRVGFDCIEDLAQIEISIAQRAESKGDLLAGVYLHTR